MNGKGKVKKSIQQVYPLHFWATLSFIGREKMSKASFPAHLRIIINFVTENQRDYTIPPPRRIGSGCIAGQSALGFFLYSSVSCASSTCELT